VLAFTATQNDADGHDTPFRGLARLVALHELPLNTRALSSWSTATQNDAETHDTEASFSVDSPTGALHELPSNVTAFTLPSAAQNDDDGHDTEFKPPPLGSTAAGALHD
jgi:hypothetical protein